MHPAMYPAMHPYTEPEAQAWASWRAGAGARAEQRQQRQRTRQMAKATMQQAESRARAGLLVIVSPRAPSAARSTPHVPRAAAQHCRRSKLPNARRRRVTPPSMLEPSHWRPSPPVCVYPACMAAGYRWLPLATAGYRWLPLATAAAGPLRPGPEPSR
ncbi:uncharacterized protein BKCO1_4200035 [Diplodia corticola]|uniref:Uncharacterized protein n=1 Tax=Diplodia corticola TaxID=236234 RepID=A0A1J9RW35_9PEZI|nr:uncharacterized protein BKCO1_4200035 [Diplodia corticola]OJD32052.1 hypothetical protein BKCO1_4200035 [Diplodia corticola]